jgi:biopolymer transport protein ExbB
MILALNYYRVLFFPGGGVVGMLLWCLSVVMAALVIQCFLVIRRQTILPDLVRQQVQAYFSNRQYREAIELTGGEASLFSGIVHAALSEARYGYPAMERALEDMAEHRISRLLRHAEWLNLIGNIGPMVGLFGTVWGLILTFFVIVESGGIPDPANLAGAIGIKLVCTLLGLVVAIPSLAAYGVMRNRIDGLSAEALKAAQDLIANFRPGRQAAAQPQTAQPAVAATAPTTTVAPGAPNQAGNNLPQAKA